MGRIIKVKKGDTTYSIKLYDTEAGAGTPGTTTGTLKLRIDGANHYARITQYLESDAAGGATPLRYKSASGNVYQVTQNGEFSITVPSSSGQTVCVSANGKTYKGANTLWFAEGTPWSAWVETDVNHAAGSLNLTGGTLNSKVTLSVTPAADIPSGMIHYNSSKGFPQTFTVPNYITVVCIHETSRGTHKLTHYYKVTPGKSYQITKTERRYKSGSSYNIEVTLYFNGVQVAQRDSDYLTEFDLSWSGEINQHATEADFS